MPNSPNWSAYLNGDNVPYMLSAKPETQEGALDTEFNLRDVATNPSQAALQDHARLTFSQFSVPQISRDAHKSTFLSPITRAIARSAKSLRLTLNLDSTSTPNKSRRTRPKLDATPSVLVQQYHSHSDDCTRPDLDLLWPSASLALTPENILGQHTERLVKEADVCSPMAHKVDVMSSWGIIDQCTVASPLVDPSDPISPAYTYQQRQDAYTASADTSAIPTCVPVHETHLSQRSLEHRWYLYEAIEGCGANCRSKVSPSCDVCAACLYPRLSFTHDGVSYRRFVRPRSWGALFARFLPCVQHPDVAVNKLESICCARTHELQTMSAAHVVIHSPHFLQLTEDELTEFFILRDLDIDEFLLFQATIRWCLYQIQRDAAHDKYTQMVLRMHQEATGLNSAPAWLVRQRLNVFLSFFRLGSLKKDELAYICRAPSVLSPFEQHLLWASHYYRPADYSLLEYKSQRSLIVGTSALLALDAHATPAERLDIYNEDPQLYSNGTVDGKTSVFPSSEVLRVDGPIYENPVSHIPQLEHTWLGKTANMIHAAEKTNDIVVHASLVSQDLYLRELLNDNVQRQELRQQPSTFTVDKMEKSVNMAGNVADCHNASMGQQELDDYLYSSLHGLPPIELDTLVNPRDDLTEIIPNMGKRTSSENTHSVDVSHTDVSTNVVPNTQIDDLASQESDGMIMSSPGLVERAHVVPEDANTKADEMAFLYSQMYVSPRANGYYNQYATSSKLSTAELTTQPSVLGDCTPSYLPSNVLSPQQISYQYAFAADIRHAYRLSEEPHPSSYSEWLTPRIASGAQREVSRRSGCNWVSWLNCCVFDLCSWIAGTCFFIFFIVLTIYEHKGWSYSDGAAIPLLIFGIFMALSPQMYLVIDKCTDATRNIRSHSFSVQMPEQSIGIFEGVYSYLILGDSHKRCSPCGWALPVLIGYECILASIHMMEMADIPVLAFFLPLYVMWFSQLFCCCKTNQFNGPVWMLYWVMNIQVVIFSILLHLKLTIRDYNMLIVFSPFFLTVSLALFAFFFIWCCEDHDKIVLFLVAVAASIPCLFFIFIGLYIHNKDSPGSLVWAPSFAVAMIPFWIIFSLAYLGVMFIPSRFRAGAPEVNTEDVLTVQYDQSFVFVPTKSTRT